MPYTSSTITECEGFQLVHHRPGVGTVYFIAFAAEQHDDSDGDAILAKELDRAKVKGQAQFEAVSEAHLVVRHTGREIWTSTGLSTALTILQVKARKQPPITPLLVVKRSKLKAPPPPPRPRRKRSRRDAIQSILFPSTSPIASHP